MEGELGRLIARSGPHVRRQRRVLVPNRARIRQLRSSATRQIVARLGPILRGCRCGHVHGARAWMPGPSGHMSCFADPFGGDDDGGSPSSMDRDDPAYRGQSDYTRPLLRVCDPLVLGFAARFIWRCPTGRLVEGYRRHIRERHLDVGPGTGYFLGTVRPSFEQPSDDRRPQPERPRSRLVAPAPTPTRAACVPIR